MPFPARIDAAQLGAQALGVAEAKGWDAWTLRDVAQQLGVTPNALYRYVGDRAGLVIAMAQAAAQQLSQTLWDSRRLAEEPDERVVQVSRRYVRFATRRPHAYAAFMEGKPPIDHPAQQTWVELWGRLHAMTTAAVPGGGDAAAFALWAFLTGRVALARGPARLAAPDAGIEDAVRSMLDGFRSRSPVPSPLPPHIRRDPPKGGDG